MDALLNHADLLLPIALGGLVGLIMALTGAGGGILSVPLLVFFLKLPMNEAGPIGLLAVGVSTALGAGIALIEGQLRYRAAGLLAISGLFFSPLGIWMAHQIPNEPLMILFAFVLITISVRSLLELYHQKKGHFPEEKKGVPCTLDLSIGRLIWTMPCARALIGSGALAGLLSGLLGVGGGFIIVPALKKVSDLPTRSIIATSLGVLCIVSLGGVLTSSLTGSMNWLIATPFALGAVFGMVIGRLFAKRISNSSIQIIFTLLSLAVAAGLLAQSIL